ncbi:hypothetical protein TRFO_33708 [Tritrichomonas foetus]|uniref:Uncharacterized protein n=1 Tax=Tritrichomonas foetus TaxID=1144522 RepID=A0A1J4JQJ5_9EUKA|nr:hypothetical protein TRFO_33708 [Tritrichomonas foetus]|eukprot:OHS99787.1 hypothetical protein TRFO_33708 [Tritrichomonas foetus]
MLYSYKPNEPNITNKILWMDDVIHYIDFFPENEFQSEIERISDTDYLKKELKERIEAFLDRLHFFIETNNGNIQYEKPVTKENIIISLINLEKTLKALASLRKRLNFEGNFPYSDISLLILNFEEDEELICHSLNCLANASIVDIDFKSDVLPDNLIGFLCRLISSEPQLHVASCIELVSSLIRQSPEICCFFINNGIFHVFDMWIPSNFMAYALESLIMTVGSQHIPTVLLYCEQFLMSATESNVYIAFNCFSLFVKRFGFDSIDKKRTRLLYNRIPRYIMPNGGHSVFLFSLLLPPNQPPKFFEELSRIAMGIADPEITELALSVFIHFHPAFKQIMTKSLIRDLFFFGVHEKSFRTSMKYAECIFTYYTYGDNEFDLEIFKICIKFIETEIGDKCLEIAHHIVSNILSSHIGAYTITDFLEIVSEYTLDLHQSLSKYESTNFSELAQSFYLLLNPIEAPE